MWQIAIVLIMYVPLVIVTGNYLCNTRSRYKSLFIAGGNAAKNMD